MPLIDKQIRAFKCPPDKKCKKLHDGGGLYLLVTKNNSKLWRMRFMFSKKHQELALGKYPEVSLSAARQLATEARGKLIQGINPAEERRNRKQEKKIESEKLFETAAYKWFDDVKEDWSEEHQDKVERWIEKDCALLYGMSLDEIKEHHIAQIMTTIKDKGTPRKASNVLSAIKRIFSSAKARNLVSHNPAVDIPLKDLIGNLPDVVHRAAITDPKELKELIRDIDENNSGSFCTIEALKLAPRLFLRPGEVRKLKWSYIDLEERIMILPGDIMKMSRDHVVPLSTQVSAHLKTLKKHTGYSQFVFPNLKDPTKFISKNVLTNSLRRLGYNADAMSAHGFRSTASTILNENGWEHNVVEMQLAHLVGTNSSRPYNRAEYLPKRTKMMQWWSDYLDSLKSSD